MAASAALLALAKKKWESSGLTAAHAKALKLEVVSAEDAPKLGPNFQRAGGIKIPYFDGQGKTTKFFRYRYLEKIPGFALAKPPRYVQPAGTINEVYLPPLLEQSWEEILADVRQSIFITEGELKAASACSVGIVCLGLGGVDTWRSQRRGLPMLPVLDGAAWMGRQVVIAYDSDAATNPNVVRAQRQLATELLARGAVPAIASIPPTATGGKQGLDDYLVSHSAEELATLLAEAPIFLEAAALWEMNEEVAYIRNPGLVIVRESGQKLSPQNFVSHAYSNRHYLETSVTKKGAAVTVKKPLARRWLDWERRFELEKITYAPGQPPLVDGMWNTWEGWGVEPEPGDVSPWEWLLDFLFSGEDELVRNEFEKWCAYPLQYPGTKMFTSAVLWGTHHGTGKTLVGYTLRRIYGNNFAEVKSKDLNGGFNEWAENKQFVYGDEITGSDRRADADALKGLITQEQIRINAKYVPSYVLPDCINYLFTSNSPDAFFLEDTDRRFFVHEIVTPPASLEDYAKYDAWLRGKGPAYLFHHLLSLDLKGMNPKAPAIMTKSKKQMIVDNKSDLGMWVHELKQDPSTFVKTDAELLSPDQLLRLYDPERSSRVTINGMARELKRVGFRQVNKGSPLRTSHGLKRLYAIRNADTWDSASPKDIVAHFEKFYGPNSKKY